MTDWTKVAPKRADNAVKALDLFAKTAGRSYNVPADEARATLRTLDEALAAVHEAYAKRLDEPSGPVIPAPAAAVAPIEKPAPLIVAPHHLQIGAFVAALVQNSSLGLPNVRMLSRRLRKTIARSVTGLARCADPLLPASADLRRFTRPPPNMMIAPKLPYT